MKDSIKEKSLLQALTYSQVKNLPDVDDNSNVWIKAIALVKKYDGSENYVCVEKDTTTLEPRIVKDFGNVSMIISISEFYPYSFLNTNEVPIFKTQKKDERIAYLSQINPDVDYSKYTKKELESEIEKITVAKALESKQYNTINYGQ